MKRFYKKVDVEKTDDGYVLQLDGKPVRTPMQNSFVIPSRDLAEAVKDEWAAQEDEIDPRTMPLNQLCNTMIDHIGDDKRRSEITGAMLQYIQSDMICYYAGDQDDLYARQEKLWQPLHSLWVEYSHAPLKTVTGIAFAEQDDGVLEKARGLVERMSPSSITAMQALVGPLGSFVIAYLFVQRNIDAKTAYDSALVDEIFQAENWGEDLEAQKKRELLSQELQVIDQFLNLSAAA